MTDPIDDALQAWTGVTKTVVQLAVAHHAAHAPGKGGGGGQTDSQTAGFTISTALTCRPTLQTDGKHIELDIVAPADDVVIEAPRVTHVRPGTLPSSQFTGGQETKQVGPVQTVAAATTTLTLDLEQSGPLAPGLHVGHVTAVGGAKLSPIVFYLDDHFVT